MGHDARPRRHRGVMVLRILALALCAAACAPALAARPASPGEIRQVTSGIRPFVTANSAPGLRFAVRTVTISTANRAWARVELYAPGAGSATAVARRVSGRWRGVSLGSDGVGCAIPSRAVRADLGLACT